jgi:dihydropteroate synthase
MQQYSLIGFTQSSQLRHLLRSLSNYKLSSIYSVGEISYVLLDQVLPPIANTQKLWLCNALTKIEQQVYHWAASELENSVEFIKSEEQSRLVTDGRLISINGCEIIRSFAYLTEIFAILNFTSDSFSDGGKYNSLDKLLTKAISHIENRATILDIGVESTNPKSLPLSADAEIAKLAIILPELIRLKNTHNIQISVDTYHEKTVKWLLDKDIDIINDVSGAIDIELVKQITNSQRKYVAMHSLLVPVVTTVHIDLDTDPVKYIYNWMNNKLIDLVDGGVDLQQIILDVGIGFGANPSQSWQLLKQIKHFATLPCELLVGHSRKSFLKHVTNKASADLDIETAVVALNLVNRVDYLRLHEIKPLNELYRITNQLRQ